MAAANYLGLRDLLARWVYVRQGVYKIPRYRDFPRRFSPSIKAG